MKEKLGDVKGKIVQGWKNTSKKNKSFYIGTFITLIAIFCFIFFFLLKTNYVPLYSNNLTQKEIGEIKAVLEKQGFTDYKIANNGTQILVPKENVPDLIVNLASEGLPKSGPISFSEQTQNLKFGVTEQELDVIERETIQKQLANLMTKISGVKSAEVMITMPKDSVFIRSENEDKASASIIVDLEPGTELEQGQIKSLYFLASKSIPNLPQENIVISNQYGQLLTLEDSGSDSSFVGVGDYENQRKIKQKVEADIQRSIQQMLGTMLGQDKVYVQTFAKLNFDKVKTQQSLVEPITKDPKDGTEQGIAVSVEEISKTYNGTGASAASGVNGTGTGDVPAYAGSGDAGNNKYQETQKKVNYEFNRITKEIIQSPYTIEDLTINVGVEPPNPKNPYSLTQATQDNIRSIISNVVRTAIDTNNTKTASDLNNRITIFPREFTGKTDVVTPKETGIEKQSLWNYLLIGAAALALLIIGFLFMKWMKRKKDEDLDPFSEYLEAKKINEFEEDANKKKSVQNEINQLAGKNTEEFVDLLRYWLKEDKEG
ncbi:flagellar basal-body MS-ring/collar protein FliF [Neobacillus sp. OS1-33]|uniref:flagellar basal-body MS-ring/collar protein FliF n=1 Tax=Neobacillus sp. OS1-33 TaxID=3070683 RepID=UPI0027E02179|nr:flagellar basal-body MS-ring/collar protein FliF [Neobacillus sp. OS1-33]WML24767.1 flagellar basal-body MS-ring/collar protein FliF [Neobacillus sp. OS1-33]